MDGPDVFELHDPGHMTSAARHLCRFNRFIDPGAAICSFRLIIGGSDQRDQAASMIFSTSALSASPVVIRAGATF